MLVGSLTLDRGHVHGSASGKSVADGRCRTGLEIVRPDPEDEGWGRYAPGGVARVGDAGTQLDAALRLGP